MEQRRPRYNREEWQLEQAAARALTNTPAHIPLTTNWPDMGTPPSKPRPAPTYYVDYNGLTMGQAPTKAQAKALLKHFPGGIIRLYHPTVESREEENRQQRELRRQNIIVRRKVV